MSKKLLLITYFMLIIVCISAQTYMNQPESVEWNYFTDTWLVSNHADGKIITLDNDNNETIFSDLLSSTRGLKVRDDKLYAASNDGIAIFDLENGNILDLIPVPSAELLNDLDFTSDGRLFVSDYWDNNIFEIDLENQSASLFIDCGTFAPNGLIFDEPNNRFIACGHTSGTTSIYSFDPDIPVLDFILYPTFLSLDGLARDSVGNIYVSGWAADAVYRFDGNNIDNNVEVVVSGLNDPADIFIHDDVLAVPNFSANEVTFHQLQVSDASEDLVETSYNHYNYPNPFYSSNSQRGAGTTIYFEQFSKKNEYELLVYDIKGRMVKEISSVISFSTDGYLKAHWDGKNNLKQNCSSGIYYYKVSNGTKTFMGKMLLLK